MKEIGQGIYYENSYPGVTLGALVLPHGTILVDAPLRAEDARAWRATLLTLGGNSNRLLVNLDAHPDRTLGARAMDCTVVSHLRTAQVFRGRPSIFKGQNAESGSEWESQNESVGTRWAIPDITFTHQITLHWGPPDVFLEHHPGPALGSIWVVIPEAHVVFIGDAVLPNQPPFLTNGDIPSWVETLSLLTSSYRDYTIISGRGGPVTVQAVRAQQQNLKATLKGLERLAKRNAPPEATENLIPNLLSSFSIPKKLEEQYYQRFRHGLFQYYARRYRPIESFGEQT
jgi:glyoxylase-like metal-dependent hydrolase (beta-lactamase superfamily II)